MYRLLELLADRVVADIAAGNYLTPVLFIAGGIFFCVELIKMDKDFAYILLAPIVLLLSPILIPLYLIAGKTAAGGAVCRRSLRDWNQKSLPFSHPLRTRIRRLFRSDIHNFFHSLSVKEAQRKGG